MISHLIGRGKGIAWSLDNVYMIPNAFEALHMDNLGLNLHKDYEI
jgi:hypothetical protein